jgi:(p)ppGpp synthase/HD superfamily hydrolase
MKLSSKFEEALAYATSMHRDQMRKGSGVPYIAHVLGVSAIALEYGANEIEAIGALLHDVVEDCGGTPRLSEIRDRFGDTVAKIVAGCTDTDQTPKPPWRERKENYIAHLASTDSSTLLVSASDKLHNARSILRDVRRDGNKAFDRFKGKKDGTLWYYRALIGEFRKHRDINSDLIDELDRVVSEIEVLSHNSVRHRTKRRHADVTESSRCI